MRLEIEKGLQGAIKQIKALKQKPKLIAVQIPEGLKTRALEIADKIEKNSGAEVVTFADPCFGACDLADVRARQLGADLLVHFGHTKMLSSEIPAIYAPLGYEFNENELAGKIAEKLNEVSFKKIALCATAQYAEKLGEIKKVLGKKGIKAEIGTGGKRVALAGQVWDAIILFWAGQRSRQMRLYLSGMGCSIRLESPSASASLCLLRIRLRKRSKRCRTRGTCS